MNCQTIAEIVFGFFLSENGKFQLIPYIIQKKLEETEFSDLVDQREQNFMCSKCYFVASTNSELQMHEMSCN